MKRIKRTLLVVSFGCTIFYNIYPLPSISAVRDQVDQVSNTIFNPRDPYIYVLGGTILGALCGYLLYSYVTRESTGDALARACQDGDLQSVQTILQDVEDLNTARFATYWAEDCPAIDFACAYGNLDIIRWMVEDKGVDIQNQYERKGYLRCGCCCGGVIDTEIRRRTPLYVACERGDVEIVAYLLEQGAPVDGRGSRRYEWQNETNGGSTPLCVACKKGYLAIVRLLLDNGADLESDNAHSNDPRRRSQKPLHAAASAFQQEIVRELLQRGAEIDARNARGETAFHLVVKWGWYSNEQRNRVLATLRLLLENGADINAGDNDAYTALHNTRDIAMVRFLVENGANVNIRNNNGETPLMEASKCRFWVRNRDEYADTVRYLLTHGAEIDIETDDGKTALYFACIHDNPDIVDILVEYGAEVRDEYEHGGIRKQDDRALDFDVEKSLNEKVWKKKAFETALKDIVEGNESEKDWAKQQIKALLVDTDLPACIKKRMLPQLFELHKSNTELLSDIDLQKCLSKITYDATFVEKEEFKEVLAFAKAKKIRDINGKAL